MPSLLFYKNVIPLNKDIHAKLKLKNLSSFAFSADTTVVPIVGSEFIEVAKRMPIAFLRLEGGSLLPIALVGLPNQKNVFLDASQSWVTPYIPAFVRRYPFIFAETGPDELTLCLDMDYAGLNEEDGEPFFVEKDGNVEPSAFVNAALQMVSEYQRQHILTTQFAKKLENLGLLVDSTVKANLPQGEPYELTGFLVVDSEKLRQISDEALKDLFLTGELDLIYAHLHSLGNILELLRLNAVPIEVQKDTSVANPATTESKAATVAKKTAVLGKKILKKTVS